LIIPAKVKSIEKDAFSSIVNAPATTVTMPKKFNNPADLSRIFNSKNLDQIAFTFR